MAVAVEGPADNCLVERGGIGDLSCIGLAGVNGDGDPRLALKRGELKEGCERCREGIGGVSLPGKVGQGKSKAAEILSAGSG